MSGTRKDFNKRRINSKQFPPLNKPHPPQSSESQPFPPPDIPVGGRLAHFVEQWGELINSKWVLSVIRDSFWIPFRSTSPLSSVLISLSQSSFPLFGEEIVKLLQRRAVERVQDPGTPGFYSRLFLVPKKECKVMSGNRSFAAKSICKE